MNHKDLYACAEVIGNECVKWVALPANTSFLDSLALSKADTYLVGGAILSCFGFMIAYVIVAKALNEM